MADRDTKLKKRKMSMVSPAVTISSSSPHFHTGSSGAYSLVIFFVVIALVLAASSVCWPCWPKQIEHREDALGQDDFIWLGISWNEPYENNIPFTVSHDLIMAYGSTLTNNSDLTNVNKSTIRILNYMEPYFLFFGSYNSRSTLDNKGTLINNTGATIINFGTFNNFGTLTNSGTLNNIFARQEDLAPAWWPSTDPPVLNNSGTLY